MATRAARVPFPGALKFPQRQLVGKAAGSHTEGCCERPSRRWFGALEPRRPGDAYQRFRKLATYEAWDDNMCVSRMEACHQ